MKRSFSLLLLFCSIITLSNAQAYYQFKGGLSFSQTKIETDQVLEFEKIPVFHAGISFRVPVANRFYVQPEMIFIKKGYIAKDIANDYEIKSVPSYVQLPVLMGIYIVSKPKFKAFIHTGPQISVGIGGEKVIRDKEENKTLGIKYGFNSLENDYDPYDFGIITGIGIELSHINLGVSYDLGIMEVAAGVDQESKMYTRSFNISIGYIIDN